MDKIINILNKYDIEKLLKMGAPKDEYSSEAKLISTNLYKDITKEEILLLVQHIWNSSFAQGVSNKTKENKIFANLLLDKKHFIKIANEIYEINKIERSL